MKYCFESLDNFVRGKDPKSTLNLGYVQMMPEIAKELQDEINFGSEYQYWVEVSNHPQTPGNRMINETDPYYIFNLGLEAGHGFPDDSPLVVYANAYVNPIAKIIFGDGNKINLETNEEVDEFGIREAKRNIPDIENNTIVSYAREMIKEILNRLKVEIE